MADQKRRVTLLDVALEAGVSRATASLVVREHPSVSPATRAKVKSAMEKLGYIYNQAAANLRTARSNTVGLIINDLGNPYFSQLVAAVQEKLADYKYTVIIASSFNSTKNQSAILDMMMEHRVCGVILFPVEKTSLAKLQQLSQNGIPVVTAGREIYGSGLDYVGIDNLYGIHQAVSRLVDLGHTRIAFLASSDGEVPSRERTQGYKESMARYGLDLEPHWVQKAVASRESAYEAAEKFFPQNATNPTALICYNDTMAFGVMRWLWDTGREPGKDIAVIGFDNIREGTTYHPRLTSVAQDTPTIGKESVRMLHERISGLDVSPRKVIFSPQMIIRESSEIFLDKKIS